MRSYLRIKSPWAQLGLFFGLVGVSILLTSFLSAFILLARGASISQLSNMDFSDPKIIGAMKVVQAISTITIFFVPALVFALITFQFNQLFFLGAHKPEKNSYYLLALLIMFASFPFVSWLGDLNQQIPLAKWMVDMENEASKQMEAFLKGNSAKDIVINLLIVAALPAICEEFCFRGVLQRIMIHIFRNPWAGIIVTAMLFSAFHMQFEGFFPRMFLGIVLGALFWYSGSLWVNIVAHFFYNGAQVIAVMYYPKMVNENPSLPWLLVIASGIIVFALLWLIRKKSNSTFARIYEFEELNERNQFIA
ncbi:MAG: CPBP family intramembrane metalloprotease [Bacteroidetes bacterium]|nr:CPBP family intramembrane metalloprotease [Bacteroidota bacterium]MBS1932685.1 CPBP family intramembrane metalloprotease [Bacteroidota bacterium]